MSRRSDPTQRGWALLTGLSVASLLLGLRGSPAALALLTLTIPLMLAEAACKARPLARLLIQVSAYCLPRDDRATYRREHLALLGLPDQTPGPLNYAIDAVSGIPRQVGNAMCRVRQVYFRDESPRAPRERLLLTLMAGLISSSGVASMEIGGTFSRAAIIDSGVQAACAAVVAYFGLGRRRPRRADDVRYVAGLFVLQVWLPALARAAQLAHTLIGFLPGIVATAGNAAFYGAAVLTVQIGLSAVTGVYCGSRLTVLYCAGAVFGGAAIQRSSLVTSACLMVLAVVLASWWQLVAVPRLRTSGLLRSIAPPDFKGAMDLLAEELGRGYNATRADRRMRRYREWHGTYFIAALRVAAMNLPPGRITDPDALRLIQEAGGAVRHLDLNAAQALIVATALAPSRETGLQVLEHYAAATRPDVVAALDSLSGLRDRLRQPPGPA